MIADKASTIAVTIGALKWTMQTALEYAYKAMRVDARPYLFPT